MNTRFVRFAVIYVLVFVTSAAVRPLTDVLPAEFLQSLTPAAAAKLVGVPAIYLPFMHAPLAEYFHYPPLVLYGPEAAKHYGLEHEAMHAIDPCGYSDAACQQAFADSLPPEALFSAAELYGLKRWTDGEAWAMIPLLFDFRSTEMPEPVRRAYEGFFH